MLHTLSNAYYVNDRTKINFFSVSIFEIIEKTTTTISQFKLQLHNFPTAGCSETAGFSHININNNRTVFLYLHFMKLSKIREKK